MALPARRTAAQQRGDAAERLVAERLERSGWIVLGRQVRAGRAELDLVAVDPGPPATLVIVEVRCRRDGRFGLPEETVDRRKQAHVHAGAWRLVGHGRFADGRPVPRLPLRFDLVAIETGDVGAPRIRHHRAAF